MHLLPLEINPLPREVYNKALLTLLEPDKSLYTWVRPCNIVGFFAFFFLYNYLTIN